MQSQLFRIEAELPLQQLRHFNCGQDVAEEEDHGICSSRHDDTRSEAQAQWFDELRPVERGRINSSNLEVFSLPRRLFGILVGADIAGFRSEKEIQDKLDSIDLA